MILSRVIEHLKQQHWSGVFVELVIVILGVFVGLQADNWNAAREDAARGRQYLLRIADNLQSDLDLYRDRLAFWNKVTAYGKTGLAYANNGESSGDNAQWKVLLAFFQASQTAEIWVDRTAYEELKSSGEFRLIHDVKLRRALAKYYIDTANPTLTVRPAYRENVRALIPYHIQHYIWQNCYGPGPNGDQVFVDCLSPISNQEAASIVTRIAADERLMGELTYWLSSLDVASLIVKFQAGVASDLRDRALAEAGLHKEQAAP